MFTKIVINNGVKIQYKVKTGNSKSPIIFLHGGGGNQTAWEIIFPYFKKGQYKIITLDLRGHGLSDRPGRVGDYPLEKHAEDVLKLIDQEKFDKVILIGHCLGGMVAATFTALYPGRVEKLILINTNYELPWFIGRTPLRQCLYLILNLLKYLFPKKAIPTKGVDYTEFIGTFDIDLRRLNKDLAVLGTYTAIRQGLALLSWRGREYLSRIWVPTLVIAGSSDLLYPKGTGEKVSKLIKNAQLAYVNSNHISVINNPREVYDKIIKFLNTP